MQINYQSEQGFPVKIEQVGSCYKASVYDCNLHMETAQFPLFVIEQERTGFKDPRMRLNNKIKKRVSDYLKRVE